MIRLLVRSLWLAAVACSLVVGFRELRARIDVMPRVAFTPRASSDSFLAGLAVEQPAESIRRALQTVPADDAIVFSGPAGDPLFIQTLYTVSFLALPRQVAGLRCPVDGGPGGVTVPSDADQEFSAVVFFRKAPGVAAAEQLAPGLSLLRIPPFKATSQWSSLCSPPSSPSPFS